MYSRMSNFGFIVYRENFNEAVGLYDKWKELYCAVCAMFYTGAAYVTMSLKMSFVRVE